MHLVFEGERRITIRGGKAEFRVSRTFIVGYERDLDSWLDERLVVIRERMEPATWPLPGSPKRLEHSFGRIDLLGNSFFVGTDAIVLTVEEPGSPGSVDSKVVPITVLPILTCVCPFTGAVQDAPFVITYDDLYWNSNIGNGVSFRVEALTSRHFEQGWTAIEYGGGLISPGESVVWTPTSDAIGQVEALGLWPGMALISPVISAGLCRGACPLHLNVPGERIIPHNMPLLF